MREGARRYNVGKLYGRMNLAPFLDFNLVFVVLVLFFTGVKGRMGG